MDRAATRSYYAQSLIDDCPCPYCPFFRGRVAAAHPELAEQLSALGIDISQPFDLPLPHEEDGVSHYDYATYIVMGTWTTADAAAVTACELETTDSHPRTGIDAEHSVILAGPFAIPGTVD